MYSGKHCVDYPPLIHTICEVPTIEFGVLNSFQENCWMLWCTKQEDGEVFSMKHSLLWPYNLRGGIISIHSIKELYKGEPLLSTKVAFCARHKPIKCPSHLSNVHHVYTFDRCDGCKKQLWYQTHKLTHISQPNYRVIGDKIDIVLWYCKFWIKGRRAFRWTHLSLYTHFL
jgi:hypothetical protein